MSVAGPARLRIVRVITRLNVGGPALQAMLITQRLDPERYETTLVTGESGRSEGNMLDLRPADLHPIVLRGLAREISPIADIAALRQLISIIRDRQPHVVHTHMSKAGLLGRLAARVCGVPAIVHTFHGNVLRGYFDPLRSRAFLGIERALASISSRIVAISRRQRDEIRELGIAREPKLVEIPLGVELTPFLDVPRGVLRAELGLPDEVPLVGIVGRLAPIKRVDLFVEAFALVRRSMPGAHAVIVGDGPTRTRVGELVLQRGLDQHVHFVGWRGDLRAIYGDLDVLVLTSDNEGTPVSVLEALAARRPVVATAVGGVPDLIGRDERGLLVPPRDPAATARAMVDVLESPLEGARRAEAGRQYVYPAHDVSTLLDRLDRLYSKVLAEQGPTAR